ncbi:putative phosphatase regulatory subunit-domain-containing protein [Mycena olivaceomarginata]|nr:putative phosphatase regulatory subunit-domain-containing protein [Mycena olivaceomarginata]
MDFRDSNTAGAPLPLLPRRSSSANRTTFASTPQKSSPPIKLVVQHATPARKSPGGLFRVRGLRPAEQNTPTPTPFPRRDTDDANITPRPSPRPLVYSPGTGLGLRALSTSHIPPPSPSTPTYPTDDAPRMVRKKSGQPVKSSLKSSGPRVRGSLAVVIGGAGGSTSKSAPTTPTARPSVHFDAQLEHVKLFLAEQKPLAVSRDGSPTDDTSGTEGDFPSWAFGRDREEQGMLEMLVDVPPPPHELDVKLQTLVLTDDATSVTGTVAVRNLAFDKWVAVRFTFDDWQTTSEVTARYSHSLSGGAVDVFSFSIRLNDLLARIEGKVMMLAVRYTSAGREMRETKKEQEEAKAAVATNAKPKGPEGEVVADLRSRLERVVKAQEGPSPVQLRVAAKKPPQRVADKFKAGGSLAARLRFPHVVAQPMATIPWPKQPLHKAKPVLGSPRDASEGEFRPVPYIASDSEDAPFSVRGPERLQRGYFDVPLREIATARTPPGTPRGGLGALDDMTPMPTPSRSISFPPLDPRIGMGLAVGMAIGLEVEGRLTPRGEAREENVSEGSTPSFVGSVASSRSGTVSPVSPPDYVGLGLAIPVSEGPTMYHSFLDRFCFYTGPEALGIEGLPRTQSVSSVEEFLSTASATPRFVQKLQAPTPLRFGDSRSSDSRGSGSTTPTTTFASAPESRSPTPVAA